MSFSILAPFLFTNLVTSHPKNVPNEKFSNVVGYEVLDGLFPLHTDDEPTVLPDVIRYPRGSCNSELLSVYVKTSPYAFEKRKNIRQQELNRLNLGNIPVIFVIGRTDTDVYDTFKETALNNEIKTHGDLLIGDFVDKYAHLRTKELFRLKHFAESCDSPYILMLDDDVTPDINNALMNQVQESLSTVYCLYNLWPHSPPPRSEESRWYTSLDEYPLEKFPPFCGGPCVMMSRNSAKAILAETYTRKFELLGSKSDVYVNGILRTLAGLEVKKIPGICTSHQDAKKGKVLASSQRKRKG